MKRILLILIGICCCIISATSQSVSMRLEYKSGTDSFYVSMIPTFNRANFVLGPSQITIVFSTNYGITTTGPVTEIVTSGIGASWSAQDYVQGTAPNPILKYVAFQTNGNPIGSVSNNTPKLLFRFRVTGAGGNCVAGAGLSRNYVNGTDPADPNTGGGDFSSAINEGGTTDYITTNTDMTLRTCTQLILPVSILEFNAIRQGNNGVLNWSAIGEEFKSDYYEIERSIDGSAFSTITKVDCRKQSGVQKYEYTDPNITGLNSKYVYYRLRQYDIDDNFIVSSVRQLKMDISDKGVQMYPNPVKSGFYLNIPFMNPNQSKVSLSIMNGSGQVIQNREITSQQATNYYYDLRGVILAAGDYYLKIVRDGQVVDIKKFLISKE